MTRLSMLRSRVRHGPHVVRCRRNDQVGAVAEFADALGLDARRQIFRELADPDPAWWDRIPDVTVPTLVIAGGSPSPVLEEAVARLPRGKLVTIPVGHWIHESEPVSFLRWVEPFLSD